MTSLNTPVAAQNPTSQTSQREFLALLEAIHTATDAIAGQPDSPAVARWLRHRADCFRRLAREHPTSERAATAGDLADLDQHRADTITAKERP